jgi:hypothetical protein
VEKIKDKKGSQKRIFALATLFYKKKTIKLKAANAAPFMKFNSFLLLAS